MSGSISILSFSGKRPKLGSEVYLAEGVRLSGDITIGDRSSLWFNVAARGDVGSIQIGEDTNIQDNSVIHVTTGAEGVRVGNRVTIGHGAIIHECRIADESLIGMGVVVPRHCLVGAGSLCPPGATYDEGSLIVGSPARVKRKLTSEEINAIKVSAAHYVEVAHEYLSQREDSPYR